MAIQRRADEPTREATPDVVLDVPHVAVESITLEVDSLRARISLDARLADLVHLHVGVDAEVERVALEIKGVEAEAHLRAHLDNVVRIVDRALRTVDEHPEILAELARAVPAASEAATDGLKDVAGGAEGLANGLGEGVGQLARSGWELAERGVDEATERAEEASGGGKGGAARRRGGGGRSADPGRAAGAPARSERGAGGR
jgi:hypothetical protein